MLVCDAERIYSFISNLDVATETQTHIAYIVKERKSEKKNLRAV